MTMFVNQALFAMLRVIVLDHHKTAVDMLSLSQSQHPNLDLQLDMNRSGATIALDYFKPQVSTRNSSQVLTLLQAA